MDVIGFGLANIDLVARVDEAFLARHGIPKGMERVMGDLDFGRMRAALKTYDAQPGGCVANTLCGLSTLGIPTQFYGKIGHDEFESLCRASFHDYMVEYTVAPAESESSQCIVLITPDGERSFCYTKGAGWLLNSDDVDWDRVARARLLYAEIYACAFNNNTALFERLCDNARAHNIPLYIKLVDRDYGERFRDLLHARSQDGSISLIVGNHDNLPVLAGGSSPTQIRDAFEKWPCPVLMTAAGKGGTYYIYGEAKEFKVDPVTNPKNSSGAGDQFMAGFIAGKLDDKSIDECLTLGARLARDILMHHQPRPPLKTRQSIRF